MGFSTCLSTEYRKLWSGSFEALYEDETPESAEARGAEIEESDLMCYRSYTPISAADFFGNTSEVSPQNKAVRSFLNRYYDENTRKTIFFRDESITCRKTCVQWLNESRIGAAVMGVALAAWACAFDNWADKV